VVDADIPVITIDGPSGSGKGTLSRLLSRALGWQLLDSGALYRLVGLAARNHGVALSNWNALRVLAEFLDVQFLATSVEEEATRVMLEGDDVSDTLRTEEVGRLASEVAVIPAVRTALLLRQRAFKTAPGLVADGRDMGTVVFPEAQLKVFLTASAMERAERRYKQLKDKGEDVSLPRLAAEIEERDRRDSERPVAPLRQAVGAVIIDTTGLTIEAVFERLIREAAQRGLV
jgi:CMP/dCMP kinase